MYMYDVYNYDIWNWKLNAELIIPSNVIKSWFNCLYFFFIDKCPLNFKLVQEIQDTVEKLLDQHSKETGDSTCHLYTIATDDGSLFEKFTGWLSDGLCIKRKICIVYRTNTYSRAFNISSVPVLHYLQAVLFFIKFEQFSWITKYNTL